MISAPGAEVVAAKSSALRNDLGFIWIWNVSELGCLELVQTVTESRMAQEKPGSKIGNIPPMVSFSQARFDDFDALAESAQQWEVDFRLLDSGGFRGEMVQVAAPSGLLIRCRMSGGVQQLGAVPVGCRTLGIPMAGCSPHHWRGKVLTEDHLLMFPPSGELDSRSYTGFQFYPLSVPETVLARLAEQLELDWVASGEERVVRCDARRMDQLRQRAAEVILVCATGLDGARQNELDRLMEELVVDLLCALDAGEVDRGRPMARARREALDKVIGVVESDSNEAWRVSELCELAGVSRRTLQYAFEERYGVSPKQYLKARRLVEVKRQLQAAADKRIPVSEVASRFGFWHKGQFAADFKSHFGCLPSQVARLR